MKFPENFLWGAGSASAQVEGAWLEDGRTPSVWDLMPAGTVCRDETPHVACDFYHRYKEDVALMKELGLQAFRFSVSWSRVIPQRGQVNEKGLAFYSDLVDELLSAGIKPVLTVHHSDTPQWIQERGSWNNPETVEDFAFFARVLAERLADRVDIWQTFNEPQYIHADCLWLNPGSNPDVVYRHMLLAHGRAIQEIRGATDRQLQVGLAVLSVTIEPMEGFYTEEEAYEATYAEARGYECVVRWMDPAILGKAPAGVAHLLSEEDLKIINQKMDFYGANIYTTRNRFTDVDKNNPAAYPGMPRNAMGDPICPNSVYNTAKTAWLRYHLPLFVMENGYSNVDFVMLDGKIHDPQRIDFICRHLMGLRRALDEGYPVIAYLYWSFMDNFEWLEGYDKRYGLVYVDYPTQKRIPKDSAYYFRHLIETNGEEILTSKGVAGHNF